MNHHENLTAATPEMFFAAFFRTFFPGTEIPGDLPGALADAAVLRQYGKKEIVIKAGEPQTSMFFLVYGSGRCYEVKPNGHEVTQNFFYIPGTPGIVASTMEPGDPAQDTIQVLEPTGFYLIPLESVRALWQAYPVIGALLSGAMEKSLSDYRTLLSVRSMRNIERCRWLNTQHPELREHFQKQYLASYLDMDKAEYSRCQKLLIDPSDPDGQDTP